MNRRTFQTAALAAGVAAASAVVAVTGPATATPVDPASAAKAAATKAEAMVAGRPAALRASQYDTFQRRQVYSSHGLNYVAYERTYKGLPVRGGDFVVATDAAGRISHTSVAQSRSIGNLAVTPKLSDDAAASIAEKRLKKVTGTEGTRLVVVAAEGKPAKLAWETTVSGTSADGPSRLTVDVDAATGSVLRTYEHVTEVTGSGTGWTTGSVSIDTTKSRSTFSLRDPDMTSLSCGDSATEKVFSGSDNDWGDGTSTDKETGCVDAFYAAQQQKAMLSSWLGRDGFDGGGGAWPIRVGLSDVNAFYDGTQVQIGHNTADEWIGAIDVVDHELGHGIDDNTPGGISQGGTQEFIADAFGTAAEWFANNPTDPPDYKLGEQVDLVGKGPIRRMDNPSLVGDPNCYSRRIPSGEVHAAAGPGDHWFYLLARGSSGGGEGQPASPTCDGSTVTGIGIQEAITILYNAMLMKTSNSSYLQYRTLTLAAAKSLFPDSCTEFNTVKAAWDAVQVPAQSEDPTCTTGPTAPTTAPTGPPPSGACTGTNGTDVAIPDAGSAVTSSITISDCAQAASSGSTVAVNILHSFRGDLKVSLVAPDGSSYALKAASRSDDAEDVDTTFTADLSRETANGTWRLRVQDLFAGDTGFIDSWTLTL